MRMLTYRADALTGDATARRRAPARPRRWAPTRSWCRQTALAGLDAAAEDAGVTVAVLATPDTLATVMTAIHLNRRTSASASTRAATWKPAGSRPTRSTRSATGCATSTCGTAPRSGLASRNVRPGDGAGKLSTFFEEPRRRVKPLSLALDATGPAATAADLAAAVDAFERTVQPAYGCRVNGALRLTADSVGSSTPCPRTTPTAAEIAMKAEDARRRILAALPGQPHARPRKPRTLLVIESLHGMSHNTIPHTNVMLERFGALTEPGAASSTTTWPTCGIRASRPSTPFSSTTSSARRSPNPRCARGCCGSSRRAGGLVGIHGTPWASRNWTEFTELIGAMDAPHRIEQGILRVYDRTSPLVAPLGSGDLPFREEHYRFHAEGARRLRWNNVRVLLTVAPTTQPSSTRPWDGYTRPDGSTRCRGFVHLRPRAHLLHVDRTHARNAHDAGARRACVGGRPVCPRRPGRRRHTEPCRRRERGPRR